MSLDTLDLITTEELLELLGISKTTLAELRRHGLERLGPGKQKFYRRSAVAAALERAARSRTPPRTGGDDHAGAGRADD